MKVLVTGASGFLGSWLTRRLLSDGCDVRILARSGRAGEELAGLRLDVATGDVTDPASLAAATSGVDSVFHLAGLIAYSRRRRAEMERVNVDGTANVVAACRAAGVRRLVHASSVVAVGASFDGRPLDEDSPYTVGHLNLGYFQTKRRAEELVRAAAQAGHIDAVMVNPSTVYGAGDARKGSRGLQVKVARGRFPFYPPGGASIVAVEDVIDAMIAAWQRGRSGERYILCGENLLLRDIFAIIAREAGVRPPWIPLPRVALFALGKAGDGLEAVGLKGPLNSETAWMAVLYHWFDAGKARRELGFRPRPAAEALAASVRWMKEHGMA
jgi:dihydroflavonol-4-reductase